jgi:hypothetical protein
MAEERSHKAPYHRSGVVVDDLSHCTPPAPNTNTGANQCQTLDLSNAIAAVVPGYVRALPLGFGDDHTLTLYVIYRTPSGITKEAYVTVSSS